MPEPIGPDYSGYLNQIAVWPRGDGGNPEQVYIEDMSPAHAISAMHKLLRWAQPAYSEAEARHLPLAGALLAQAVGEGVVYSDDLPEVTPDQFGTSPSSRVLTEETCFDALHEVDKTGQTHPVTRARILASYLNTH